MERLITNIKRQGINELGGVFLENKKDKEAERINPYVLKFKANGEPDFAYEKESVLGKMEYEGMKSMQELALRGKKYLIWMSPPGGISSYTEGRVVVGKVLEADGEVKIECRGIPLLRSRDDLQEMALKWMENGGVSMDEIKTVEDIRQESIGINLENDDEFWDKCQQIFGVPEVWDYIRTGKDIVNKKNTEAAVIDVMKEIQIRGNVKNEGLFFEMMMKSRGFEIVGGNHGGTNMDIFGGRQQIGVFSTLFNQSELMFRAEYKNGKRVCPCGETIAEGSSRCSKCGLRFSQE